MMKVDLKKDLSKIMAAVPKQLLQITVNRFLNCHIFPENLFSDGMLFSGEAKAVNSVIIW